MSKKKKSKSDAAMMEFFQPFVDAMFEDLLEKSRMKDKLKNQNMKPTNKQEFEKALYEWTLNQDKYWHVSAGFDFFHEMEDFIQTHYSPEAVKKEQDSVKLEFYTKLFHKLELMVTNRLTLEDYFIEIRDKVYELRKQVGYDVVPRPPQDNAENAPYYVIMGKPLGTNRIEISRGSSSLEEIEKLIANEFEEGCKVFKTTKLIPMKMKVVWEEGE